MVQGNAYGLEVKNATIVHGIITEKIMLAKLWENLVINE